MKNLAGVADCDTFIRTELERARIEVVEGPRSTHEVAASLTGKLGPFTFTRAWYYWIARGPVPLEVARELYADPVGKTDVRSGGDCACRPPETWATYFDADGWELCSDPDGRQAREWADMQQKGFIPSLEERRIRFVPDAPAVAARAVVETYHIDSEVGLRLFADTIRARVSSGRDAVLADELIARLNSIVVDGAVRDDVAALIAQRIACSSQTALHRTIQVGQSSKLGFLGLLNGIVGIIPSGDKEGWGYIAANYEHEQLIGFVRTDSKEIHGPAVENLEADRE